MLQEPSARNGFYKASVKDLSAEAMAFLAAGEESTANTLVYGTFNLLRHPHMLENLRRELWNAIPNVDNIPPADELENLPYLVSNYRVKENGHKC